jgi:hypothetical protein
MSLSDNYTAASGAVIRLGRAATVAVTVPAWAASAALNTPLLIPNSAGMGGAAVWAYSGFGIRQDTGELFSLLSGGHGDSSDNRVTSFPLMDDAPVWALRNAATPAGQIVQDSVTGYNADGKPVSRHVYDSAHFIEQLNRFVFAGYSGGSGGASRTGGFVDSFDPAANVWDAAGTWPNVPDGNTGHGYDPTRGHIWTNSGYRFDAINKVWSKPISSLGNIAIRFPMIHDPVRDIMFCCMFGSNWAGSGTALNASKWNANGTGTQVAVTFNASSAYTQFLADQANFTGTLLGSGMTYDHANGCFWWYIGTGGAVGHLYKITPNSGTAWDMELVPITLPTTDTPGINGCIKYVKKLKGLIISPFPKTGGIYFVRTT